MELTSSNNSPPVTENNVGCIDILPQEMRCKIFDYLSCKDLCALASVSRAWQEAVNDKQYWKEILIDQIGYAPEEIDEAGLKVLNTAGAYLTKRCRPVLDYQRDRNWYRKVVRYRPLATALTLVGALLVVSALVFLQVAQYFYDFLRELAQLRHHPNPIFQKIGRLAGWGQLSIGIAVLILAGGAVMMFGGNRLHNYINGYEPGRGYTHLDFDHASFSELNKNVDWGRVGREGLLSYKLVSKAFFLHEAVKDDPDLEPLANVEFATTRRRVAPPATGT
jgi:hypothetical protein